LLHIIEQIIVWALGLVSQFGYGGIFLTQALESAAIPIPSEVIVPFGGFLASSGSLNFWLVVLAATLANLTGGAATYFIGLRGGRPLIERYGKYVLIHPDDVSKIDGWVNRYGAQAAFFSRLLPGVRTFSSLIIGAGRVNFNKFFWYTLFGSFLWNLPLAYAGFVAGNNWDFLRPYFHKFELAILAAIIIGIILFIFKHVRKFKHVCKGKKFDQPPNC
jgi:membrane protein DedA with SNARE-associated domain